MLERLEECLKRWHRDIVAVSGILGVIGTLLYFGILMGRQLTENMMATSQLREMNTNIKAMLSRQTAFEVAQEEQERLLQENARQLDETIGHVTSTQDTIRRHINEERESRWWMLHRLDGLDHKGVRDKPNGGNGR